MSIIHNKYTIVKRIGSGQFGTIYKGKNIRTEEWVAIKTEPIAEQHPLLPNETKIYQYLNGCRGIPQIKWFGKDEEHYYMVMELLGDSLRDVVAKSGRFSLRGVVQIGVKLIQLMKTIHEKGVVHRDVKPDNLLFGGTRPTELYLVDFGLCRSYLRDGYHIPTGRTSGLIGSPNYASIHGHQRAELGRRDDMESLGYVLLYLYMGKLPWDMETDEATIEKMKREVVRETSIPNALRHYLQHIRSLEFEECPNYFLLSDNLQREGSS